MGNGHFSEIHHYSDQSRSSIPESHVLYYCKYWNKNLY